MKRDDPKRMTLRAERVKAQLRLDMLCKGLGHILSDGYRCDEEDVQEIINLIKSTAANEAYRPYWGRRRRISGRVPKKRGTKK